jgi:hypothetical protein
MARWRAALDGQALWCTGGEMEEWARCGRLHGVMEVNWGRGGESTNTCETP